MVKLAIVDKTALRAVQLAELTAILLKTTKDLEAGKVTLSQAKTISGLGTTTLRTIVSSILLDQQLLDNENL